MCEDCFGYNEVTGDPYTQCLLVKKTKEGRMEQRSWIPTKFAKKNRVLKLRDHTGTWDNGWIVEQVGATRSEDLIDAVGRFTFGSTKKSGKRKR